MNGVDPAYPFGAVRQLLQDISAQARWKKITYIDIKINFVNKIISHAGNRIALDRHDVSSVPSQKLLARFLDAFGSITESLATRK